MSETPDRKASAAPTIVVTWWGALLAGGLFALWIAGDVMLADWLGLDFNCAGGAKSSRSGAVEMVICSAAAGPKGWLFLAWLAAPMIFLSLWLGRTLRHATPLGVEVKDPDA